MSDENRLLKRLRNQTVRYIRDKDGKIIGIEDPAAQFRLSQTGEVMQPGPPGAAGKDGASGIPGSPGKDGSKIYFGLSPQEVTSPKSGDVFVNTATWDVYYFT